MEHQIIRYSRQILISQVGSEGQHKLSNATVAVIGCGGLGSIVIPMLAAAGIGNLHIFDNDTVSISNLNRQIMYKEGDVGKSKVDLTKNFVSSLNSAIKLKAVAERITPRNYEELLSSTDLVIDCTDGLVTKFFLNDCCLDLEIPLIHSAATGFDIQLLVIMPKGRPCLRCYFETLPIEIKTCAQLGILGSTCSVVGGLATNEAIKYIIGLTNISGLIKVDLMTYNSVQLPIVYNPDCIACGSNIEVDPTDQNFYSVKQC